MRRISSSEMATAPLWSHADLGGSQPDNGDVLRQHRQREIHEARERGYREGYTQGEKEARERVTSEAKASTQRQEQEFRRLQNQLEASRKRLDTLFESLSSVLEHQSHHVDEVAVGIAYAAVTKFLGDRYADRSLMQALVDHALTHVGERVDSVHVSEQDFEQVEGAGTVRIVSDARLLPGQCTLETRLGHYETGLDVRLELLKTALLSGLARHRNEERQP